MTTLAPAISERSLPNISWRVGIGFRVITGCLLIAVLILAAAGKLVK